MVLNVFLSNSKNNILKLSSLNKTARLSDTRTLLNPVLNSVRLLHSAKTPLTPAKLNVIRHEYFALSSLFKRSGLSIEHQSIILKNVIRYNSSDSKPPRQSNENQQMNRQTSKENQQTGKETQPDDNKNDEEEKMPTLLAKAFLWLLTAYFTVALLSVLFPSNNQQELIRYVSWNEFLYQMLAKGEVKEVIVRPDLDIVTIILHDNPVIKGRKLDVNTFHMNIVDVNKFEEKLRIAEQSLGIPSGGGIQVVYERDTDTAGRILVSIILASIIFSLFSRARIGKNPLTMDRFRQLGQAKFTLIDPLTGHGKGVRFTDVAGLKEAKMEVMEVVDYLKRPQHYKNLGAKVPHGVLLLGPPGCGKTLLAKAVATEAEVPFLSMNGSEFVEMIGGLGAARVRDLFKEGRRRSPCIIYIDEIDALGRKRSSGSNAFDGAAGEEEQTLNQLLVEMDGMMSKEGVLLLASTNRADVLDKALLRPGRFDRHILIDLPNMTERAEIFESHMKSITLEEPPNKYSKRLAYLTPGMSGADIANVVNEAALHAARMLKKQVDVNDLEYAVERVVGGTEKRSSTLSMEEKRVVATHEAGHALAGWLLPDTDVLLKVTIVPRTNLALGFAQYTPSDKKLYTKEQLFGKICMALGGRVAEALEFNKITTGAQNDLDKVTKIAYSMVREFGMSSEVGLVSFPRDEETSIKPFSGRLSNVMDIEVNRIIGKAYKETEQLLRENIDKLRLISENLLKKETLNYDDVEKLIGPPLHGKKQLIDPVTFEQSLKDFTVPSVHSANND